MEQRQLTPKDAGTRTIMDESHTNMLVSKWGRILGGITDKKRAATTAIICENEADWLRGLNEETRQANAGSFTKYIFPILRRVFPNLIAHELMSVQPMSAPIGAVFYYEMVHTSKKGSIEAGDNLVETFSEFYSSEYVPEESAGTGNGTKKTFSGNLDWTPIRPKSDSGAGFVVTIADAAETFTDDGNGVLTGSEGGAGTINYTTGAYSVTFDAAPVNAGSVAATYYYNSESNSQVPEVEMQVSKKAVEAQTRKLKARWSAESADDLRAFHGIDAEAELVAMISNEIALEIDRELVDMLVSNAALNTTWAYDPGSNSVGEMDSIRNLLTLLSALSARIHRDTNRAPANFIVTTPEVVALLEQLATHGDYRSLFVANPDTPFGPLGKEGKSSYGPLTANFGYRRVGVLSNKWTVYIDPKLSAHTAAKTLLIGLKGRNFMDAGAVYAPYIPLQVTPTFLDPDDQTFRKGMRTRYAKKMLRPEYYATVSITGLPTAGL